MLTRRVEELQSKTFCTRDDFLWFLCKPRVVNQSDYRTRLLASSVNELGWVYRDTQSF